MIRGQLLDWTETLEMKENNRVATAIDHTIDVLARLVEHQSSKPINQPKNQERCEELSNSWSSSI